jgi:hypothetical protein
MKNFLNIGYFILAIIISISLSYNFVVRPIQKDKALNSCLDGVWTLYASAGDEIYNVKVDNCIKEFK